jgi:hypothetical protein
LLAPRRSRIDRAYRLLGKGPEELFPVRFHALVPTKGAKLAGEIRAFAYLRSARSDEVAEVR